MKKQLLFLSVAIAALLAGCSKTEPDAPGADNTPSTHISAKARGAADVTVDTKAPLPGTSLNGKTADVYTSSEHLDTSADRTKMFTDAYARGTMTFDDNNYVFYNTADFDGKDGGNSLLPTDGSPLYMYGFYPAGWTRTAGVTFESLTFGFDGHHDVMGTWLTAADDLQVKYNAAPAPDKADFIFKHLLTRYNIQVKASDADALNVWGRVQSVTVKEATVANRVVFAKKDGATLGVSYDNDGVNTTPASLFKLTGTIAAPTYADDKFETADYASAFALTTTYQNACYTMVAPVAVDASSAAELTLVVKTVTAAGKALTVEVPVTLDQSKFNANANSTRGFSITLALNFRVGVIQATAIAEEWKDYGTLYEDVDLPAPPKVGDAKDGGIVYWVDPADPTLYKVFSLDEGSSLAWAADATYVIGSGAQSDTDGRANVAEMKAYSANTTTNGTTGTFATDFPAAGFCDAKNTGGVTGWYLPAKDELMALSKAYRDNETVLSGAITANHGTAPASGNFWSSTEHSSNTSYAWRVGFAYGSSNANDGKGGGNYVRCVKSTVPAPPKVGDAKDGGIVYEVNGANYKVFSLDEGSNLKWAAQTSYVIGSAGQSDTDGKGNVAAMKAYSANTGTNSTLGVFADDFPAAEFCDRKNTGGVTGWYLPATDELVALSTAYNTNKDVLDKAITDNKGTDFVDSYFWSSTESSVNTSYAWRVGFSYGDTDGYGDKDYGSYVRCVRAN